MSLIIQQATPYEASYDSGTTGLVGTIEIRVDDNDGATVYGPTPADIAELGASGVYVAQIPGHGVVGEYTILWSDDGSFAAGLGGAENVSIVETLNAPDFPPLMPITSDGSGTVGPCQAWTTSDDVAECCGDSSDPSVLDLSVIAASQLLYALSGKRYSGECERRVRPCRSNCGCGFQVLSRGHVVSWEGAHWHCEERACGCGAMSSVELTGWAREILEVTIDGAVVPPDTYRLDERRFLARVRDPDDIDTPLAWPLCQAMDRSHDEDGTFSVLYTYGVDPPVAGVLAARELACNIYAQCAAGGGADLECALPQGATKIERQGITIELQGFVGWGFSRETGWSTGMPLVDAFLNAYNPNGLRKRPQSWTPDARMFPRPVGA
jgi:hypothetical protein